MSILKEFEHLTNGDVAEHLASHRLVQEGQRQKRFEGVSLPFGNKLIQLIRERLTALTAEKTPVQPPLPAPVSITPEAALADIASVTDLDSLADHYGQLFVNFGNLTASPEVVAALGDLKARVLAAVAAGIPPVEKIVEVAGPEREVRVEVPAPAPSDEAMIEHYNSINNLADLETELAGTNGDAVVAAVTAMAARVRDAVIASIPAPGCGRNSSPSTRNTGC